MSHFLKKRTCPSSGELAEMATRNRSDGLNALMLAVHLRECEFCVAELDLYSMYPPMDELVEAPPIPLALKDLAESLLTGDTIHISRLDELLVNVLQRHGPGPGSINDAVKKNAA